MALPLWLRILFLVVSSALAVMTFPPAGLWWMGLLAWAPLLFALQGTSPRLGFRLGLLWGFLTYAVTLSWLWTLFGMMAIFLWLMLAAFIGLFGLAYGKLSKLKPKALWPGLLATVLWVGLEYFRGEVFTLRFPWITAGTGVPPNALTPLVGTYGVTFAVLLGSAWLVAPGWLGRLLGAGCLGTVACFVLGPRIFYKEVGSPVDNGGIRVALVQSESGEFDELMERTRGIPEIVDAIVWPEHSVPYDVRENVGELEQLKRLASDRAQMITLGCRTDIRDGAWDNIAVTVGPEGVLGVHEKNHPVHFFDDGTPGRHQRAIETPLGPVGTPICFDCDYSGVCRQMTANGAKFFLVPSMDPATWPAKQHEQHARLFQHRAAENKRSIAVAATSGVTQIINPFGEVVDRLPLTDPGVLVGTVGLSDRMTLFTRHGWKLGPLCAWLALGILGWVVSDLVRAWLDRRKGGAGSAQNKGNRAMVRAVDVGEDAGRGDRSAE